MEIRFSEHDIRGLLSKVTIYDPTIGDYQFFTVNEQFSYIVKLSNGTIHFTIDELIANREQRISNEQLILISTRFSKSAGGPQRRRDSAIPEEYLDNSGNSEPQKNQSKKIIWVLVGIITMGIMGAMAAFIYSSESGIPSYPNEQPDSKDTTNQQQTDTGKLN